MPAQHFLAARLPSLSFALLAAFLVATAVRTHNDTTTAIIIASVLMFACCCASATHLLGARPALTFVLIALGFGWFAEQMDSTMSQTRPLQLPTELLNQVADVVHGWSDDPHAPRWLNRIEDRLTTQGSWSKGSAGKAQAARAAPAQQAT